MKSAKCLKIFLDEYKEKEQKQNTKILYVKQKSFLDDFQTFLLWISFFKRY